MTKNNRKEKYKIYVETVEKAIYTYADLHMKNDPTFSLVLSGDVASSDLSTKLGLQDFKDSTSVTFDGTYTITKSENGKVNISPSEIKINFDGIICSKEMCN